MGRAGAHRIGLRPEAELETRNTKAELETGKPKSRAEELDGGRLDRTISNEGDLELGRTTDDERDCRLDRTSGLRLF